MIKQDLGSKHQRTKQLIPNKSVSRKTHFQNLNALLYALSIRRLWGEGGGGWGGGVNTRNLT